MMMMIGVYWVLRLIRILAPDDRHTCVLRILDGISKQLPPASLHRRRPMIRVPAGLVACSRYLISNQAGVNFPSTCESVRRCARISVGVALIELIADLP